MDRRPRLPDTYERGQKWRDLVRTNESDAANGDGRVLEQRLGRVGSIDDEYELLEHHADVVRHVAAVLDGDLADGPYGVVAHGYVVGVEIHAEHLHEVAESGPYVLEAGLGQIAEEGERALADLGDRIARALIEQREYVAGGDERRNERAEALGQAGEQVERDHHEVLVGQVDRYHATAHILLLLLLLLLCLLELLLLLLLMRLGLVKGHLDERQAALEHRLAEGQEADLQRRRHTRQALEQRKEVLVLVAQRVPLVDEWRHELLDVLGPVELIADRVGESAHGVVENEQVLGLVLAKGGHERVQYGSEIGHELVAGLLLERGKGRARGLLHSLVRIEYLLEQLVDERPQIDVARRWLLLLLL